MTFDERVVGFFSSTLCDPCAWLQQEGGHRGEQPPKSRSAQMSGGGFGPSVEGAPDAAVAPPSLLSFANLQAWMPLVSTRPPEALPRQQQAGPSPQGLNAPTGAAPTGGDPTGGHRASAGAGAPAAKAGAVKEARKRRAGSPAAKEARRFFPNPPNPQT